MQKESLNQLAFVFWDAHYDDVLAVTYTARLRQAGIATKIVGLHGKQAFGKNGLLLTADNTLGEVLPLAEHAVCIVVPCHSPNIGHLDTDPRARIFLERAAENGAHFVAGRLEHDDLEIFPVKSHQVQVMLTEATIGKEAKELGTLLAGRDNTIAPS